MTSPIPFSNVSTSSLSAAEILTSLESDNPNIFDSYDNITYHFKLSYINQSSEVIIAESGKTDVYITECSIESFVGQDFRVRNTSIAKMSMELRESHGTTLFDKLLYVQNNYSGGDYKTTDYRITLTFYGYDQAGTAKLNIGGVYKWDVILDDMNFKIDLFGTVYNLTFSAKQNIAFSDEIGTIKDGGAFVIDSGSTLGSILGDLANFMNARDKEANFGVQMTTYAFADEPYSILSVPLPISINSPFDMVITNNSTANELTNSSFNDDVVQYAKGVQISKYIESLISNSPEASSLVTNTATTDSSVLTQDNPTSYSITYKIVATVDYGDFDKVFNRYKKNVTYTIIPRISVNAIQSTRQVETADDNFTKWSVNKFSNLYNYKILTKKYDYIFTGKNTNVFDFNITGNMFYALNFPMLDGARSSSTSIMTGQVASNEITKNLNFGNDDSERAMVNFKKYEKQNDIKPDDIVLNTTPMYLTDMISGQSSSNEISNAFYNINASTLDNVLTENYENERLSLDEKLLSTTPSTIYVDDVFTTQTVDDLYIPVNFTSQENSFQYSGSTTNNVDNTQIIFSTIMNQVYSQGTNCLQDLEMKIRFDPYWIGCANVNDITANKTIDLSYNSSDSEIYNNFDIKDICMVLEFNIPEYSSDTTQVKLNRNDMISGVYQVYKVTHTFGNGEMHQTLNALKLVQSNLGSILNFSSGE